MAKVALLIGVSEYEPGLNPLPAAVKDVEAMRRVLVNPERGGFAEENITVLPNPQRQEMEYAIEKLFADRQKDDLLLFYFSGHGIKDEKGKLYLSTRSTRKNNGRLVKTSAVAATMLHDNLNESRSQRQVLILDCCFSGAIAQGLTVKDDGSVNVQEHLGGRGRAILTASTSTQYSFEQEGSELSIYTRYLVEGIEKGAADTDGDGWISVDELHDYTSSKVTQAAPAMTPKFYPVEEGYRIRLAKAPVDDPRLKYRKEVEGIGIEQKVIRPRRRFSTAHLLTRQQFLKLAGFGGAGLVVTVVVRALQSNTPLKVFDFDVVTVDARKKETKRSRKQAKFFTEDLGNGVGLQMVSIPGGKFLMGSPESEPERSKNEGPQHTVTLQPFFMGKFAVTQAQWQAIASLPKVNIDLKPDPSNFKGANRPVELVSWYEAVEFCARLSKATGREYRLPSEAEWEYACRAGTTTPFHFGETISPELANYNGNYTYASGSKGIYREQTTEVGRFPANAFGLYDMHGNVVEWCEDTWHENYNGAPTDGSAWIDQNDNIRLLRGGSWHFKPSICRSASRGYNVADSRLKFDGFRVVCAAARTP